MEDFIAYSFQLNSGESTVEKDNVPEDRIIHTQIFSSEQVFGSYFSCIYNGKLRIHIVFDQDTDAYNTVLTTLVKETIEKTHIFEGKMWISNENVKIVEQMKKEFQISPDSEPFLYESHELIMPRDKFHNQYNDTTMEIRPYQQEYIDQYVNLLCSAMDFKIPPCNYIARKDEFVTDFVKLNEEGMFEAFWKDEDLVGLYWICQTEIDHIAVAKKYQHQGYAKQILTRAIERLFLNPEIDCAWLLVVEWNSKAFKFYKKYGMVERAVYHVPYKDM